MENIRKLDQVKKNIVDTMNGIEPDRIPVMLSVFGWGFGYSGARCEDLISCPKEAAEIYCRFLDEIDFDMVFALGQSQPAEAYQKLGLNDYLYASDGNSVMHDQVHEFMFEPEVYDEIIKDPGRFLNDTLLRKKCPVLDHIADGGAYDSLIESIRLFDDFNTMNGEISRIVRERKDPYFLNDEADVFWVEPFQKIFMNIRGMRNALTDLRRRPEKVFEACEAIDAYRSAFGVPVAKEKEEPLPLITLAYHPQTFLNGKMFDKLFFEPFKKVMLPFAEAGRKIFILLEGDNIRTMDRYQDFPKGSIAFLLDMEDPFEMHKTVGDRFTLMTGMPAGVLATETPEGCAKYVEKCYDAIAPGGGLVFAPSAPLMGTVEAPVENVVAAYRRANELSIKK